MNVVSKDIDLVELLLVIKATKAEVLIITPTDLDKEPGICSYLLVEYPHLKIIALSAKINTAFLYKAGSCRQRIDDMDKNHS